MTIRPYKNIDKAFVHKYDGAKPDIDTAYANVHYLMDHSSYGYP